MSAALSLTAEDRVLAALETWFATHEDAPHPRELAPLAGLVSIEWVRTLLTQMRRRGLIVGKGRGMRLTANGVARAVASTLPPSGARPIVAMSNELVMSRQTRSEARAQLEARLEVHVRIRDENDAEIARLDEAIRALEDP